MRTPVAEPGHRVRMAKHLTDGVEVPAGEVERRQVEQGVSVAGDDQVVGELECVIPGANSARRDRIVRIRLVVGRIAELVHRLEPVDQPAAQFADLVAGVGFEHPSLEALVGHDARLFRDRQVGDLREDGIAQERVQGAREPEQEADRAGRDLCRDRQAVGTSAVDPGENAAEAVGLQRALHQRERQRAAGLGDHLAEHVELVVAIGVVRNHLEDAATDLFETFCDADEFVSRCRERRGRLTAARSVVHRARRREAQRSRGHPVGDEPSHLSDLVDRRRLPVCAALAHHVEPNCAVRYLGRDVDVVGDRCDGVEVVAERLPFPAQALVQSGTGNVLDALHEFDEAITIARAYRRETDPAVAHHDGGDAVRRRRCQSVIPRGLAVVVRVDVDEPGDHQGAVGVDLAPTAAGDLADRDDRAVGHRDVGGPYRCTGSVHDGTTPHDEVVLGHAQAVVGSVERSMP